MNKKDNITIFLGRDGVINKNIGSYITKWRQFKFMPHILSVLKIFKQRGYRVIVVTNQGAIGEGLMTKDDLLGIHTRMLRGIINGGGRIHQIYVCPHTIEDDCHCRKPRSEMFIQAKKNYPMIDFNKSFMIGDSWFDMDAAASLGIKTCMLIDKLTDLHRCQREPDFCISDISQALKLVPTYFDNLKQHKVELHWESNPSTYSRGIYIDKNGDWERFGNSIEDIKRMKFNFEALDKEEFKAIPGIKGIKPITVALS